MKKVLFALVLVFAFAGCSEKIEPIAPSDGGGGGGKNAPKPVVPYFKQFMYKVSGKCSEPDTVWFRYLTSEIVDLERKHSDGSDLFASVDLFLLDDNTYKGTFNLLAYQGGRKLYVYNYFHFSGETKVNGDRVILKDFGVGDKSTYKGMKSINVNVHGDFRFEIADMYIEFVYGRSRTGHGGLTIEEYCVIR